MKELDNRPYLLPNSQGYIDNSANILTLNSSYLFYWDGKNLKAFNKATGAGVGTPLITTNIAKMCGGIYVDACNNVYVGSTNGTIKVYNFNGNIFDDAPADITVAGYATKSVYDIAYNEADKLLYASGDGFVASYDIATTCPTNNVGYNLNIATNSSTASATATLNPTAPTGAQVVYTLAIGNTIIATNSTGIFTGLQLNTNYKITATINPACSGIQVIGNFTLSNSSCNTPAPTVTPNITYCQGQTATALTATGTNLLWYTTSTGGTSTSAAPTPSTTAVGTTTYYVSQTTNNCESPRASITVQVTAVPLAPTVTTPTTTYCQGQIASTLTATGTNLLWYTTSTGGTSTSTAPTPSTTIVGTTSYYVSQTTNNCESPRATITVQVTAVPLAPTVPTPTITYCQGQTATALTATGTNLKWYLTATGGTSSTTAPTPSTTIVGITSYYVSQTTSNCESPRATITVQVTALPIAPTVTPTITYCQGQTALALSATGTNLLWYTTSTGGTSSTTAPTPSTTIVGTTSYYVSQTTNNCESPRATISVQVNAVPLAPTVATPTITYCQGQTATALTATGTNLKWYLTATGGTSSTTAPTLSTTAVGTTTYYVSQSAVGGCESPRATITVNIIPALTANAGNTITITAGTSTQLNATATAGADYTWTSTTIPISLSNVKILNPIANPLQTTTYSLTVKDLSNLCPSVSSSIQVVVINTQKCINVRNAFTPNGDGKNDLWKVYDQDYCLAKDGAAVKVYNRYGSKVYENKAYKNTWDGTYNSKPLPDGTYYAIIIFTLQDGSKQNVRSDVTIVR